MKPSLIGAIKLRLLGLSQDEATFARRGFVASSLAVQTVLEAVGSDFVTGYNAALATADTDQLADQLDWVAPERRGFAYEGASMACTLLDTLAISGQKRWKQLLAGPGSRYFHLLFVGAGWAWARLPIPLDAARRRLDPLYGWLAIDGFGFHHGYFAAGHPRPRTRQTLQGYARRAFDQGLGRSLWFVHGADIDRISAAIQALESERHADLWSGIGLAAAYAGPLSRESAAGLAAASRPYRAALAQGVCFASAARVRADNLTPDCRLACTSLAGLDPPSAAELTDRMLPGGTNGSADNAYELWRVRIQSCLEASLGKLDMSG